MATVRIGHASINEKGTITGGVPGDQTGKEVCIRNFYNLPANVMIVCNDKSIAKQACDYMTAICNDPDFGYCQGHRLSGFNAIMAVDGDGSLDDVAKAAPSEFDCSSLASSCYRLAGVTEVNVSNTTRTMRSNFQSIKRNGKALFTIYTDTAHCQTSDYAEPGAIYLREGRHVVMAIDYGAKAIKGSTTASAPTNSKDNAPTYSVGKNYTLQVALKVRTGAGTQYAAKTHDQLTASGKQHDADKNGSLDKGTVVTCQQVKIVGSDIWIKAPSGWLAAYYKGNIYIS